MRTSATATMATQIANNDAFDCGGLRFEVIEPTQTLRTVYQGSVLELSDPRKMADPRRAFVESPKARISLDLTHEAVGPMYGGSKARDEQARPAEEQFASAHYEHMIVVQPGQPEILSTFEYIEAVVTPPYKLTYREHDIQQAVS